MLSKKIHDDKNRKLVVVSILDDEWPTLEVNRVARREGKADNEVSMRESRALRLHEMV